LAPQSPVEQSPFLPAFTFVLIFTVVFPIYEICVDCQASAADMDIPIGGACIDVRFDFHSCLFLFPENLLLVAHPQVGVLATPSGPSPFSHG
jgi:hypothetical protein